MSDTETEISEEEAVVAAAEALVAKREAFALNAHALVNVWLEGDLPVPMWSGFTFYSNATNLKERTRALGGYRTKSSDDYSLTISRKVSDLSLKVVVSHNAVCEKKVVGTEIKVVQERVGVDTRRLEDVSKTVEKVEWVCPQLLGEDIADAVR
tara:strand:+ start:248 stop:706 length:459 start_codon:yes stop_codon:yes gene_type:complete